MSKRKKLIYSDYLRRKQRDPRGRIAKPPPTHMRLKGIFHHKTYYEFLDMERNMATIYRRAFTRMERIILFCKVVCDWGRDRIMKETGITKYQIDMLSKKVREWDNGA